MGRERAFFQVCGIVMLLGAIAAPVGRAAAPALDERDADRIAVEAYHYFYPLVTMDVSRRQLTNIEPGKMLGRGPMNTKPLFSTRSAKSAFSDRKP